MWANLRRVLATNERNRCGSRGETGEQRFEGFAQSIGGGDFGPGAPGFAAGVEQTGVLHLDAAGLLTPEPIGKVIGTGGVGEELLSAEKAWSIGRIAVGVGSAMTLKGALGLRARIQSYSQTREGVSASEV